MTESSQTGPRSLARRVTVVLAFPFILLIRVYQLVLSPLFSLGGARCRFVPTCSEYAIAVLKKDGVFRGSIRAVARVLRCHPWHPGGLDPP